MQIAEDPAIQDAAARDYPRVSIRVPGGAGASYGGSGAGGWLSDYLTRFGVLLPEVSPSTPPPLGPV